MLKKWGLTNFKSIYNADLELAPLTVLTGTNSSGKSSLLQSMLMVAQTIQNQFPERTLVLNGHLVKLGRPDDIMSFIPKGEGKTGLKAENVPVGIRWEYEFSSIATNNKPKAVFEKIEKLIKINALFTIDSEKDFRVQELYYEVGEKNNEYPGPSFEAQANPDDKNTLYSKNFLDCRSGDEIVKINLNHFLPGDICLVYPKEWKYAQESADSLIAEFKDLNGSDVDILLERLKKYENELAGVIRFNHLQHGENYFNEFVAECKENPKYIVDLLSEKRKYIINKIYDLNIQDLSHDDFDRPMAIEEDIEPSKQELSNYFKLFKYLGPLRYRAYLYPFSVANNPEDVGKTGEYTAAVFDAYRDSRVFHYPPAYFENKPCEKKSEPLKDAVSAWLKYLCIAEEIKVIEIKDGYEVKSVITAENGTTKDIDLNQVGTGVSQIFPILVMGLLADDSFQDYILVFEQPEEQLHPMVQSRLADFFISMALSGRQCIVETHSEYFIEKLRLRIAQAQFGDNSIREAIKIYFSTKDGLRTKFNEVKITEYGSKEEWPDGFFDESLLTSEAIINAVRKKIKESGDLTEPWGNCPYDGYDDGENND